MGDLEERAAELGIVVPDPLPAGGLYSSVVIDGDVAYASGTVAVEGPPLKLAFAGRLGDDLSIEDGKLSARGAILSTLGNLKGRSATCRGSSASCGWSATSAPRRSSPGRRR